MLRLFRNRNSATLCSQQFKSLYSPYITQSTTLFNNSRQQQHLKHANQFQSPPVAPQEQQQQQYKKDVRRLPDWNSTNILYFSIIAGATLFALFVLYSLFFENISLSLNLETFLNKLNYYFKVLLPEYPFYFFIFGLNISIFLFYRICLLRNPQMAKQMLLRFSLHLAHTNYTNLLLSMFTSGFFHERFLHLCFNMFVLHSFASNLLPWIGNWNFSLLYLGSCFLSSLLSLFVKRISLSRWRSKMFDLTSNSRFRNFVQTNPFFKSLFENPSNVLQISYGASGAVYGLFGAEYLYSPESKVGILLLPFSFSLENVFFFLCAFELIGILFLHKSALDHAGHLGGLLGGLVIFYLLRKWNHSKQQNETKKIHLFQNASYVGTLDKDFNPHKGIFYTHHPKNYQKITGYRNYSKEGSYSIKYRS